MWIDDQYPRARTRSLVKVPLIMIEKLIDSEEFDLGIVDMTDFAIALPERGREKLTQLLELLDASVEDRHPTRTQPT